MKSKMLDNYHERKNENILSLLSRIKWDAIKET
jgi:hypothetical protein